MSGNLLASASLQCPFDKLSDELVCMICDKVEPKDARMFMCTSKRNSVLGIRRGWCVCPIEKLWAAVPQDVTMLILKNNWEDGVDEISLPAHLSDESLEALQRYGRQVRTLNIRHPLPPLRSGNIQALKSLPSITPQLEELVVFLRRTPKSFLDDATHCIHLCAQPSLRRFSVPTYPGPPLAGVSKDISGAYKMLEPLMERGVQLRELELDYPFSGELSPSPAWLSGLNGLIGGITRLSLHAELLDLISYDIIGSLPHLTDLSIRSLWSWPTTFPETPPDSNEAFPSLRCVELARGSCELAADLIALLPPRLQIARFYGLPSATSNDIFVLMGALGRHRDTLQVLHIEKKLQADYSPYDRPTPMELDPAATDAMAQLHQLMELSCPDSRTVDHSAFLATCTSWPLLTQLHMPQQWVSAETLIALAPACPRLRHLSIALSATPEPALPGVISSSLPPHQVSDTALELTCMLDHRFEAATLPRLARRLERCWASVKVQAKWGAVGIVAKFPEGDCILQ